MPKDFNYRGKTVDELQSMSMDEFIGILPSRMRRSLRRGLSEEQRIVLEKLRKDDGKPVRTHARDLVIMPEMIGKTIEVYNGKDFVKVELQPEAVFHYLGEFALTRRRVSHGSAGIGATRSSKYVPLK